MTSRALVSSLLLVGCTGSTSPSPTGSIAVNVGGLSIPGLTNACYGLTITSPSGGTVIEREGLCADDFGDGESSITFIAPCDASSPNNTVTLVLESLTDTVGPVPVDSYVNPCGDPTVPSNSPLYNYDGHGPCSRSIACNPNADSLAAFDLTVMRSAGQGFFDIMVAFDDVFCSAKADCTDPNTNQPRALLFAPGGATRIPTAVFALACTSGDLPADTHLYMTALTITCQGAAPITLSMHAAAGNQFTLANQAPAPLTQAAIYRGAEQLINQATNQPAGKLYQNVALGFELDGDPKSCTATLTATATNGTLDECTLETSTVYPTITWQVDLTNASGTAFACTQHALDEVPLDDVFTSYPTTSPTFTSTISTVATLAVAEACDDSPSVGAIEGIVYFERWQSFMDELYPGRPIFYEDQPESVFDVFLQEQVDAWDLFGYDAPVAPNTWDRLWRFVYGPEGFDLAGQNPVISISGSGGYAASVTLADTDDGYRFENLPTDQTYCVRWMNAGFEPFNFPRWPVEPQIDLFVTQAGVTNEADWPDQPVEQCGLTVTALATTTQDFGMTYGDGGFTLSDPPPGELEVAFYWEGYYASQPTEPTWPAAWLDYHTPGYQWDDDGSTNNVVGECDPENPVTSTCDTIMSATLPWGAEAGVESFDIDLFEDENGTLGTLLDSILFSLEDWMLYLEVPAGTYCLRWNNPPGAANVDGDGGGLLWSTNSLQATVWPSEPYQQYTGTQGPDPMWDGSPLVRCGLVVEADETLETGFGFVFHD